ncbi:hypothetical protein [Alkalicoccus halolimnae]|uniref:Uncharacterized protein n=1 Tax=Alkalicoccus halolimnae TaxID=1667239 RepID=A0A5C7FA65_9BACI|nr:hypothetical protein [Alkalicoccus halolimnae]TXF87013.1 hypothetical protein FTX54_03555 [Alkalicoccus halolimnae]
MINKIILITGKKLSVIDYEKYGLYSFYNQGLNVEILDVSAIMNPINYKKDISNHAKIFRYINIEKKHELIEYIEKLNKESIICCSSSFPFTFKTIQFYRLISKKKIPYFYISNNYVPQKNLENTALKIKAKKIVKKILFKTYVSPANFIAVGGATQHKYIDIIDKNKTSVLFLHSYDFEKYLHSSSDTRPNIRFKSSKYAVFLDQNLPGHRDLILNGSAISSENYYEEVNSFFDYLEENLNIKVVIAGHPRSKNMSSNFGGRNIYFDETVELVKNSEFVLSHYSTAINYAVLFRKPALFIATKEIIDNKKMMDTVSSMASLLGKKPIILNEMKSNFKSQEQLLEINEKLYLQYEKLYIVHPQKRLFYASMWCEIHDHIKEITK